MTLFAILLSISFGFASSNFSDVFARTRALYEPVAAAAGGTFSLETHDSTLASASADRDFGGRYIVRVETGLLTHPKVTDDVLTLILCHELGHLFGGDPLRPVPEGWDGPVGSHGESLTSAEGQADFYASSVCFRRLAKKSVAISEPVPLKVKSTCEARLSGESALLCERAAVASLAFLNLNFNFPISFETPATEVVDRTLTGEYPSRQCRLDTLFLSATISEDRPLDLRNASDATQERRLPCWYRK